MRNSNWMIIWFSSQVSARPLNIICWMFYRCKWMNELSSLHWFDGCHLIFGQTYHLNCFTFVAVGSQITDLLWFVFCCCFSFCLRDIYIIWKQCSQLQAHFRIRAFDLFLILHQVSLVHNPHIEETGSRTVRTCSLAYINCPGMCWVYDSESVTINPSSTAMANYAKSQTCLVAKTDQFKLSR